GSAGVLFRGGFGRQGERLGARPAMLGDVEQHTLRPEELLLEIAGLVPVLALVDVVLGAEALELLREFVDILDEHAEMVDAAELHPLAELVGLEFEDRHVERAVAQEDAVGEIAVRPADLLEIEGFLVEFGHRLGVFGGDRDVAELGHRGLLALRVVSNLARSAVQSEASHSSSSAMPPSSRAMSLPTRCTASSRENRPKRSNSGTHRLPI